MSKLRLERDKQLYQGHVMKNVKVLEHENQPTQILLFIFLLEMFWTKMDSPISPTSSQAYLIPGRVSKIHAG